MEGEKRRKRGRGRRKDKERGRRKEEEEEGEEKEAQRKRSDASFYNRECLKGTYRTRATLAKIHTHCTSENTHVQKIGGIDELLI